MLGVLLITILNIGSAALLVKLTRNNATTTLRETAAVRRRRGQLRRPPRHAAAPRRFRKSGNQREARNAIGVSGASVPGACTAPPESSNRSVNIGCKPYDFYFYASGDIVSSAISQSGQWETKNTRMVLDALRRPRGCKLWL